MSPGLRAGDAVEADEVTRLLQQAEAGSSEALERVAALVYDDFRRRAARIMGPGRGAVTLQPTALVNEAWLKLVRSPGRYADRRHFLAVATKVMLRVLIDHQRARGAEKRGGDRVRVTLAGLGAADRDAADVIDLEAALARLEALDPRKADVVRLRGIWGLEMRELAETLEISLATAERDWRFARNWLAEELGAAS